MGDRPQQLGSSQGLTGPPRVRSDSVSIEVDAKIASTQRTGANPEGGKVLNDGSTRQSSAKKAHRPADDLVDNETDATATGIDSGIAFGQR